MVGLEHEGLELPEAAPPAEPQEGEDAFNAFLKPVFNRDEDQEEFPGSLFR